MGFYACKKCDELTMVILGDERELKNQVCRVCGSPLLKRRSWKRDERDPNSPPPILLTVVEESNWRPTDNDQPMGGWHEHEKIITAKEDVGEDELRGQTS